MSAFNEDMPLDEYYNKCVLPKPNIPPSYPGVMGNNGKKNRPGHRYFINKNHEGDGDLDNSRGKRNRQARRLYSYKDHDRSDDDDNNDDDDYPNIDFDNTDVKNMDTSEYQDTNLKQINYEMNNFNEMYGETSTSSEQWLIQVDNVNRQAETFPQTNAIQDIPAGSAQWRIQLNNVNRPAGAPPLVPNNAPQSIIRSRFNNKDNSSGGFRQQWKQRQQQQQPQHQQFRKIQNRLGPNRLRPSHQQQQHQSLQHNIRNAYNAFSYPGLDNSTMSICQTQSKSLDVVQNINNHFPNNTNNNNEYKKLSDSTTTIGSLINTVSNIPNNCLQNTMGGRNEPRVNPKEELLLGDLVKMDSISQQNINVQEVASNVLLLLQNVVHKPIHDHQVQQEINFLQHTSGIREPGSGVDVAIQPQATHQRMYHRFKVYLAPNANAL